MFCKANSIWILSLFFIKILKPVNLQIGVPIYGPPMIPAPAPVFPAPMPLLAPAVVPAVASSSSSSSSEENKNTTTKKPKKKKCSIVFPALPAVGCVPAKSKKKPRYPVPVPMPPIIAPQPLVLVPIPPVVPARPLPPRRRPRKKLISIFSSSESTDTSSSSEYFRDRRYRKRRRQNLYRRSLRSSESDNELLKPMLSYIADNGDVKFETKISNDDVAELLGRKSNRNTGQKVNKRLQTVQVLTERDEADKPQVVVISKDEEMQRNKPGRHKQVLLRGGVTNHVLSDGRKELIFRPPADKKISNLSLSFQIS